MASRSSLTIFFILAKLLSFRLAVRPTAGAYTVCCLDCTINRSCNSFPEQRCSTCSYPAPTASGSSSYWQNSFRFNWRSGPPPGHIRFAVWTARSMDHVIVVQGRGVAIAHTLHQQLDDLLHGAKTPFVSISGQAHRRGIYRIGRNAEWVACFILACQPIFLPDQTVTLR